VAVAKRRRLPAQVLNALSMDDDILDRSAIHANKSAPDGVCTPAAPPSHELHYDLQVCNVDVRKGIAGNPNTPADALATLATDPDGNVRLGVARNPNTPAGVLAALATDPDGSLRFAVAGNPSTPADALTTLAIDETISDVRIAVAKSRRLPAEVMNVLSLDDDIRVRSAIHANKSAPDVVRAQAALLGVTAKGTD
jgi:hypothetical protein